MRHVFLVNPHAGRAGSTEELRARIEAAMAGRDYAVSVAERPGDVERLARRAARAPWLKACMRRRRWRPEYCRT